MILESTVGSALVMLAGCISALQNGWIQMFCALGSITATEIAVDL